MGNVTLGQFSSMGRKQMVAVGERKGGREGRERPREREGERERYQ